MSDRQFAIWEGVYEDWEDAPVIEGAFDSSKWLDDQTALARKERLDYQQFTGHISPNAISHDYILPTVLAMVAADDRKLRVLDFGGGLASSYLPLIASLPERGNIEFHVVESRGVCERGRELFASDMNLFFHEEIPTSGHYDVIHAGRSFQYVDDWRGLLHSFADLEPDYLVLAGVLAGENRSFVSLQNYYGYKIRVRFLNFAELIEETEKCGFEMLGKSLHLSKRLGKTGPLPMENLPEMYRLEHPCQLLFRWKRP
ncbi:methyltransferase, TIGR04325 family [Pseudomonadota bacterium]